jgi:hypothetical protein
MILKSTYIRGKHYGNEIISGRDTAGSVERKDFINRRSGLVDPQFDCFRTELDEKLPLTLKILCGDMFYLDSVHEEARSHKPIGEMSDLVGDFKSLEIVPEYNIRGIKSEHGLFLEEVLSEVFALLSKSFKVRATKDFGAKLTVTIDVLPRCPRGLFASGQMTFRDLLASRPVKGVLEVCARTVIDTFVQDLKPALRTILLHEMFHILGFTHHSIRFFVNPHTLERLHLDEKNFRCYRLEENRSTGKTELNWDIPCTTPGARAHWAGVDTLQVPDTDECRGAPLDPTVSYSQADVETYFRNRRECPLYLITPHVVEAAKNLPSPDGSIHPPGMRLQFEVGEYDDIAGGDHWDDPRSEGEVMNPSFKNDGLSHVGPYTLAFLKDSGWYEINDDSLKGRKLRRFLKNGKT